MLTMIVEWCTFISEPSLVLALFLVSIVTFCLMSINIYLVLLLMQSRPVHVEVTIPVQSRTDDQRALMTATRVVGDRPVPQENDG